MKKDPTNGIIFFQKCLRNYMHSKNYLNERIYKCREICASLLININNNFTFKKININSYHTCLTKLEVIKNLLHIALNIEDTLQKKHYFVSKACNEITNILHYITCADVKILLNWVTNNNWSYDNESYKDLKEIDEYEFVEKYFLPIRFWENKMEDINISSPEDIVKIEVKSTYTEIKIYDMLGDRQFTLCGNFKKDPIKLANISEFFKLKFDQILNTLYTTNNEIPHEFKIKFLEQMRIDDIIGKNETTIIEEIETAYKNVKEYKNMPLNLLVTHFMNASYKQKSHMLTLLVLYETYTRYIATVLFDFLMTSLKSELHLLYCEMHWTIQKLFEYSYKETNEKLKTIDINLDTISLEKRLLLSNAPEEAKLKAMEKMRNINSSEGGNKSQQWIEGFLKIPFNKIKTHKVIDELDKFKKSLADLLPTIKKIKRYSIVANVEVDTCHKIDVFFNHISSLHRVIRTPRQIDRLNDTIISTNTNSIDEDDSDMNILMQDILQTSISDSYSVSTQSSVSTPNLNLTKLDFSDNDIPIKERLTIENGTIKKKCEYIGVADGIIENPLNTLNDKDKTLGYSEKRIFHELNKLKKLWEIYKQDRKSYIQNVKSKLDKACYGHEEGKLEIQRLVGQWINGNTDGTVIGIQGPPGNGKTTLAKMGIASCLLDSDNAPRPFAMLALGGSSNASTLVGHNFTYVGASWGKIVDILITKKCMNPIIYIDEIDKVSRTEHGREIIGILTHLTDSTQNDQFEDRYFSGIHLDLSKALIVMSFNDSSLIDPILKDRMHIIRTNPLTNDDKINIVTNYVLPSILEKVGFSTSDILIDKFAIEYLINTFTYEAGVRKLKEFLFEIIREINLCYICDSSKIILPFTISIEYLNELFKKKHKIKIKSIHNKPSIGLINGLYATTAGIGGLTTIEVLRTHSSAFLELTLTGNQGDVMKESIKCAKTIAWNLLSSDRKHKLLQKYSGDWLTLKDNDSGNNYFYNNKTKESTWSKPDDSNISNSFGLHIHTPECATPKDGPSAGAAITIGIVSQLTEIPIKNNIALTGEIDLNGNITAIGGVISKLSGAYKAGVIHAFIPFDNKSDLDEIINENKMPELTNKNLNFKVSLVSHINELIPQVLVPNDETFVYNRTRSNTV